MHMLLQSTSLRDLIRNEKQQKRYSALDERIRELSETTGDNYTDGEE